jgi:hypothetical protein
MPVYSSETGDASERFRNGSLTARYSAGGRQRIILEIDESLIYSQLISSRGWQWAVIQEGTS